MTSTDRNTAGNTGLAKVAVQCSADTFVVNQSLVLRINICGENRHLRQARKRYEPFGNHELNFDLYKKRNHECIRKYKKQFNRQNIGYKK